MVLETTLLSGNEAKIRPSKEKKFNIRIDDSKNENKSMGDEGNLIEKKKEKEKGW
jgi:hypothetical protein